MALTVTATASGAGAANGTVLAVRVLNNAATTQNGATAQSTTTTTPQLAVTPHAVGSMIYGSAVCGASGTAYSSLDANSTSLFASQLVSGEYWGLWKSSALTASTSSATYGWAAPTEASGDYYASIAEILASGGTLAEDASTPAVASAAGAKTVTTASFTPPGGSVLVAVVTVNWTFSGAVSIAVSDSASAYTWTQLIGNGTTDLCSVWVGVPSSVAVALTTPNAALAAPLPSPSAGATVALTTPNAALAAPLVTPAVARTVALTTPNLALAAPLLTPSAGAVVALTAPNLALTAPLVTPGGGARTVALTTPNVTLAAPQLTPPLPFPRNPLGLKLEILVNGTWVNISAYVYQRADVVITRGLPNETQSATPSQMTLTLNNRDGRFSTKNPSGAFFPYLTRNTQARASVNATSASGAQYSGYRFWGETSSFPVAWDPTGNDVYASITVSGPFRRYVQGAAIGSAMEQYFAGLITSGSSFAPYACWPCEDGSSATQFSSLLPGGSPMTWTGTPGLSSSTAFGGSDPLPTLGGSTWHGQTGAPADTIGAGTITRTVPGSYSWKCPSGVTAVTAVECDGGGGAGGDTDGTTGGSGGGGGEKAAESTAGVTAGTTYAWSVGAGGVTATGGAGTAGGNSVFAGGTKTVTAHGGGGGGFAGQAAGAGGTGSSNTTHSNGGAGGQGQSSATAGGSSTLSGSGSGGGQATTNWTTPSGFTHVTIAAQGAGGGGAGGSGGPGGGNGGGGGGGGGYSYGTLAVTPTHSYTMKAGNGGSASGTGGASSVTGDSATITGNGGAGASGTARGSGGTGTTASGSGGGSGGSFAGSGGGRGYDGMGGGAGNDSGNGFAGSGGGGGGGSSNGSGGAGGGGFITWTWGTPGTPAGGGGGASAYAGGASGSNSGTGGDPGKAGAGGSVNGTTGNIPVTPAVPANNTYYDSTFSYPVAVTITGGTGTSVWVGDNPSDAVNLTPMDATYIVPANGVIALEYTVAPTWTFAALALDGTSPGGGGCGAVPGTSHTPASPGAAGRTTFTWTGGTATPVAAGIIRFFLDIDPTGTPDGAALLTAYTYGTVAEADVVYHSGGYLELTGYNGAGTLLFDSGSLYFGADSVPLYVDVELVQSGGNVNWSISAIQPGVSRVIAPAGSSGSVSGTVMYVSDIVTDIGAAVSGSTVIGWITCQTQADTLSSMAAVTSGYDGERGADRVSRLCSAAGLGFELTGRASDTPQMGPQQDDTLLNILQSCADLDRGQLYETRDQLGVGYRTRVSMQNQSPALTAYYASSVLSQVPVPTQDDQYVRNNVTVTRVNGGSATAALTSGPMSTQAPPAGAGNYTYAQAVQAYADSQLANLAQWIVTVGTVDEYRFPRLTFSLARAEAASLFAAIPALDVGGYVQVPDPPSFLQAAAVKQLVLGYTETLNARKWDIALNCVPESPYEGGSLPSW